MDFFLHALLSFVIIIPVIVGVVRFSKIDKNYHPFIFCLCLGLINETLSVSLAMAGHYNIVNSNIYMLLESFLLLWQFKRWGLFLRKKWMITLLAIIIISTWVIENFIFFSITHFDSYFLITHSFVISFLSIANINKLIITERKKLIKNSTFILCVAFVMYYTVSILSEAFWIYGIEVGPSFSGKIHDISIITNLIAILLYTVAILWMPSKQKFTLPSL